MASKKKSQKAKKSAKRGKKEQKISNWTLGVWGSREDMCDSGQEVFDTIMKLEKKGKTPAQIIAFFTKNVPDALELVYDQIGWPDTAAEDRSYDMGIDAAIDELEGISAPESDSYSDEYNKAAKAFNAAAEKELARLNKEAAKEPTLAFEGGEFLFKFD